MGLPFTFILLGIIGGAAFIASLWLWPSHDPEVLTYSHDGLPHDHDHVGDAIWTDAGFEHSHGYVIDDRHPTWPKMS